MPAKKQSKKASTSKSSKKAAAPTVDHKHVARRQQHVPRKGLDRSLLPQSQGLDQRLSAQICG
jgi:hypothetical protein